MKHVRIATYEIKKGSFQELADVAQDGMLREFRNQPGFIRYGLADSGDQTLCLAQPVGDAQGRRCREPYLRDVGP